MDTDNQIEIIPAPATMPAIITASGPAAPERFLEFFAANIRNPNTRRAYAHQVMQFLIWCEGRSITSLRDVRPLHVAGYIETMQAQAQTVKQALAAIRMLFDWLVIGQIVPTNPAAMLDLAERQALDTIADGLGRSRAALIREAVQRVWLKKKHRTSA